MPICLCQHRNAGLETSNGTWNTSYEIYISQTNLNTEGFTYTWNEPDDPVAWTMLWKWLPGREFNMARSEENVIQINFVEIEKEILILYINYNEAIEQNKIW